MRKNFFNHAQIRATTDYEPAELPAAEAADVLAVQLGVLESPPAVSESVKFQVEQCLHAQ